MMQTGLIEILVMIALIPYVAIRAWLDKFNHMPQREAETAKAAHGAAIAILMPLIMRWSDRSGWLASVRDFLPYEYWPYFRYRWFVVYAAIAFGVYWFCIGAARSRGYRDMRYIARSALKLVVGMALTSPQAMFLDWPLRRETFALVSLASFWMIITGAVRLGLYLRGPPRPSYRSSGAMPYGESGFVKGLED
jgi:hypothetical protein